MYRILRSLGLHRASRTFGIRTHGCAPPSASTAVPSAGSYGIAPVGSAYKSSTQAGDSVDSAIRFNCALAIEHLLLAATALPLRGCWIKLYREEEVASTLLRPEHLFPVAILPIGEPDQNPAPRPRYALNAIAYAEEVGSAWEAF